MALIPHPFKAGDLVGSSYVFQNKGDDFPTHSHTPDDVHITIVVTGGIRCKGRPEIEGVEVWAGNVIDWEPNEPHGFNALVDNTKIINIIKKAKK